MELPNTVSPFLRSIRIASYVAMGVGLLAVLWLKLLPALLAGLLVFELVHSVCPLLSRRISSDRARVLVVAVIVTVVVGLLVLLILGGVSFVRHEVSNSDVFWEQQVMPLVEKARQQLPQKLTANLPDSVDELRTSSLEQLRAHAGILQLAGKESLRVFLQILIGLVLGAIVSLSHARPAHRIGPLALALSLRCQRLAQAFHNIMFAQLKIALLNTLFTALFVLLVLPVFGVQLPLAKSLVLLTFVAGLLPVIGNLVSNVVITVVALSVSFGVGVAALVFLILIHKLEYFLNARIVGGQIRASAWELLVAMIVMEAAFGLAGLVAAPIYYAYLKSELEAEGLV